ncbi:MAG TPA: choice-of-anchor Q domain-containing protein [Blastocatellia bacterium]|nr:choice-of-anchor Q domain-containing protein [Blastocatellia bacterium]
MIHRTTSKAAVLVSSIALLALMAIALTTVTKRVSAATFTVTNLDDSGDGSLRQAILDANANPGADFIDFQDELTGTITLTSGELLVTDDLTINGPGIFAITVSGNNASRVFEIIQTTSVTISGLTISDGKSQGTSGGGIIHSSGTLTISNVLLTRNTADISGGGIDNLINSTLIVTNSTLSGNSSSSVGGGIQNDGTLTITNSTLSGNTAGFTGGGIGNDHGDLTITNSTVSGNSASSSGGGISNFAFGTANISFTTMSGNSAVQGGGIYNAGDPNLSTVNIKNSIVANSTSGGDCSNSGTFNPTGTNFTTNGTCPGFTQVTPAQLNLGPLADNGGPTQTHALLPGSVAIDAVPDCTDVGGSTVGTDQRGVGRPQGSACDVGAYEFVPCNQTPAIICPESFSVSTDPDKCAAVVEFSPQADCPCSGGGGALIFLKRTHVTRSASAQQTAPCVANCSPPSGSTFPKGETTVICTASDSFGNTSQPCSFTITVNDTVPPMITCPTITSVTPAPGGSNIVTFTQPAASDNCPGVTASCDPPSGSTFPSGCSTVTCTATDTSGNTSDCSFEVCGFNVCLQDDSNPGIVFQGNSSTGEYRFCCGGTVFTGTARVTKKGNLITFEQNGPDRRLLVRDDESVFKGSASLQFPPGVMKCTIGDRDTRNDSCVCQSQTQ